MPNEPSLGVAPAPSEREPEPPREATAVLEEDGRLRATSAFKMLLGLEGVPRASSATALRQHAGFEQDDESGTWQREALRLRMEEEPLPGGRLVTLSDAGATETDQQRQVRILRIAAHDIRGPLSNVRSYA